MPRRKLALLTIALLAQGCVRAGYSSSALQGADGGPGDDATTDGHVQDLVPDGPRPDGPRPDVSTGATLKLFLALEGTKASYFRTLTYDPTAAPNKAVALAGPPLRLDGVQGGAVRGLTRHTDGTFLAGNGEDPTAQRIRSDGTKLLGLLTLNNGTAPDVQVPVNIHGLCALPGGNLIVGEYGSGTGNAVAEYTLSAGGASASFLRPVHATKMSAGTLSHCVGTDTVLYMTELDANTDANGDVVRLTLGSAGWAEAGRLDTSSLDALHGATKTAIYTFMRHTDGPLYIFPLRRFDNQIKQLIRCSPPGLLAAGCTLRGTLPPDTSSSPNGPGTLNVAVQVPGSADLLFATNSRLYRYRLTSDTYEELLNLSASFVDLKSASGAADTLKQVRGLLPGS